jgi:hypothetical protein
MDADHAQTVGSSSATRDILDVGVSQDLRRIEESICWPMSATPKPRIALLPPVLGLAPLGAHEGDSLLLDPDTLFPPRAPRRVNAFAIEAAKILLVSAITAPTTYFIGSWLQSANAPSDPAAVTAVAAAPAVATPAPQASVLQTSATDAAAPKAAASQQAPVSSAVRDSGKAAKPPPLERAAGPPATGSHVGDVIVAMAESPASAEAAPARPTPVKPTLGPDEIAMMVERGRAFFDDGDVAAARTFFRRAANAGDSQAAIDMGSTYDPEVLAQRFTRGIRGDAEEAQRWYDKAKDMGQRVKMLAQRR